MPPGWRGSTTTTARPRERPRKAPGFGYRLPLARPDGIGVRIGSPPAARQPRTVMDRAVAGCRAAEAAAGRPRANPPDYQGKRSSRLPQCDYSEPGGRSRQRPTQPRLGGCPNPGVRRAARLPSVVTSSRRRRPKSSTRHSREHHSEPGRAGRRRQLRHRGASSASPWSVSSVNGCAGYRAASRGCRRLAGRASGRVARGRVAPVRRPAGPPACRWPSCRAGRP